MSTKKFNILRKAFTEGIMSITPFPRQTLHLNTVEDDVKMLASDWNNVGYYINYSINYCKRTH